MWTGWMLMGLTVVGLLAACASPEPEWMKIGQAYTREEFRRDYTACSKQGKVDEECMRSRGWVDVTPKPEKAPERYVDPRYRSPQQIR